MWVFQESVQPQNILCLPSQRNCFTMVQIFFFLIYLFYLFIFVCIGSSLLRAGFLQLWRVVATLHCGVWASHCGGLSCCRAQALGAWASVIVARRLSSCGARAQLFHDMWDLPGPGLEPVLPALAGGFLTTAPPGKPSANTFFPSITFQQLIFMLERKKQDSQYYLRSI